MQTGNRRQDQRLGLVVLAAGLVCGPGCGLSSYEQKMEEAQQAQRQLEEEAGRLERAPLKLPENKRVGVEAPPTLFGFRPPKGISTTPEARGLGPLSSYRSTATDSGFKELLIGVGKASGRESFEHDVLEHLGVGGTAGRKDVTEPDGTVIHFDSYQEDGPKQATRVYFCQAGDSLIAIAFRIPAGSSWSRVELQIDASLATLRIGRQPGNAEPAPKQSAAPSRPGLLKT